MESRQGQTGGTWPSTFHGLFCHFFNHGEETAVIPIAVIKYETMIHPMDVKVKDVLKRPEPQDHYNQAYQSVLTFHQVVIQR